MFRHTADNSRPAHDEQVTVRRSQPADESALSRLAELDGARAPTGPALIAESDARIVAALPLGSGRPIADPFEPSAHLVALLEYRATQLARTHRERRGILARVRRRLRRGAATA
jgi:hypothetical protein